ncbi:DUF4266 domain-containing protein [Agaribacterium sp. ZY112]|uniref:DUF4266 domain-containing protein n=1 Tax=Agaribacterium sp. ZY112 TaxID=3233574 RepID=UPI0035237FA1
MRCIIRLVLLSLSIGLSACSIQPWVQSHERAQLADPIMAFEAHPVATRYINHVYEAREAARGAEGSAGGGCGCN